MVRFKFNKDKIILSIEILIVEEFYNIYKWGKRGGNMDKLFKYIYHIADLDDDNPTMKYPPDERVADAKFRAYHDKNYKFTVKEKSLIDPAVEMYKKLNSTASIRILDKFESKSNQLVNVLNGIEPKVLENDRNGATVFVSNVPIITKGLTELDDIRKRRLAVMASIKNQAINTKVRGKLVLSPLSKGMIKIRKDD